MIFAAACAHLVFARDAGAIRMKAEAEAVLWALYAWLAEPTPDRLATVKGAGCAISSQLPPDQVFEFAAGAAWSTGPRNGWFAGALTLATQVCPEEDLAQAGKLAVVEWALHGRGGAVAGPTPPQQATVSSLVPPRPHDPVQARP